MAERGGAAVEARVVDLSAWAPEATYDEGLALCRKLKLIEMVQHGDHDYGRLTERGKTVLFTLMTMAGYASDPENILKQT